MGLLDRFRRRPEDDDEEDDAPRAEELVPQGGTWNGLLFDNPSIGLEPALTWGFEFEFADVERDYGDTGVSLSVEWVPMPGASWKDMAGREAACEEFAEPIECSAYFFEHHRYDRVRLRVLEQQDDRIRVRVEAEGDIDGLGVPSWSLDEWLTFTGINVSVDGVSTREQAAERLARFTDLSGLEANRDGSRFCPPRR